MAWPDNVTRKDLKISFYRGSGPGGQHRNKVSTACRMKHIPTGEAACSEEFKSQLQNKKAAFVKLANKLVPMMKRENIKKRFAAGHERIRTYKEKENQVLDTRVPHKVFTYRGVLDGAELGDIVVEIKKNGKWAKENLDG